VLSMIDTLALNEWMRIGSPYPREFTLHRKRVNSYDELLHNWNGVDEYASIFSSRQLSVMIYDTVFFDIDGKTIEESYTKYKEVIDKLGSIISRQYFSGRGFHIYVDLQDPITTKQEYKTLSHYLARYYKIEQLIDPAPVGDVRRMARLPSSQNSKTHMYMIRLFGGESLDAIKTLAAKYIPLNDIPSPHKYKIELTLTPDKPNLPRADTPIEWRGGMPACIVNAEMLLNSYGELNHIPRLHYAAFMTMIGDQQRAYNNIKHANDFNEHITTYQLNYIAANKTKPFGCSKVTPEVCPFANKRDCPYYPSLSSFARKNYAKKRH